ncbi:adenylate kinase [Candidatus Woesearchaeota archaeon]|nr:adenylate kinase [Candidatus Woesearchaeota archaeon]
MNIVMLGAPGAGKGTYAQKINAKYGMPVISTGDIFRAEMANKTELGKKITQVMESGQLVPDELTNQVVKKKLMLMKKGFILDGYPRTVPQAEFLDDVMKEKDEKVDFVLYVDTPKDLIVERLSGRLSCKNCGAVYNIPNLPPKIKGVCDKCGKALYQREDDKPEMIEKRFDTYQKETEPVINFYEEKGILHTIDGNQELKKALADIFEILGNKE